MKEIVSEFLLSVVEPYVDLRKQLCLEVFLCELQRGLIEATARKIEMVRRVSRSQPGGVQALLHILLRHGDADSWSRYVAHEVGRKKGSALGSLLEQVFTWLPDEGDLPEDHPVSQAIKSAWNEVKRPYKLLRFPLSDDVNTVTQRVRLPALREFLCRLLWRGLHEYEW